MTLLFAGMSGLIGLTCRALKLNHEGCHCGLFLFGEKDPRAWRAVGDADFGQRNDLSLILLPIMFYHPLQLLVNGILANRWARRHHRCHESENFSSLALCSFLNYLHRAMANDLNSAPHLFSPLTLRSVTLRNRIGVSPMCQYSATDGFANDWHYVHLGSRAVGGAGLVIAEAQRSRPGRSHHAGCLGLWSDQHIEPLARIAKFVKRTRRGRRHPDRACRAQGVGGFAWNGGAHLSEAQGGWETIAPSAIPFGGELTKVPHAMTEAEIVRVQNDFVANGETSVGSGL